MNSCILNIIHFLWEIIEFTTNSSVSNTKFNLIYFYIHHVVCIKTFKEYCVWIFSHIFQPPDGEVRCGDRIKLNSNEMKKEPTHKIYLFKTFLIFNLFIFTPVCPCRSPLSGSAATTPQLHSRNVCRTMYENYTLFVLADVEYNESSKILIKWDKFLPEKRKKQRKK